MPYPSSDLNGTHYVLGPRQAIGFLAVLKELFSWKLRIEDEAYSYYENTVTGDRKAILRKGVRPRVPVDHLWLGDVK